MAIKNPFMVKGSNNAAVSSLSLTAKPGESLRVKGLKFGALTSNGYIQLFIDRVSVGVFYAGDINANHLEQYELATLMGNLFDSLLKKEVMPGYPVAEGQTFEVKPYYNGSTVVGQIIYELGEKDDFKKDSPNGSEAKQFTFINYGTNSAQFTAGNYGALDTPRNPSEYPAFPYGAVVPARMKIDVLGVLVQCWKDSAGNAGPSYGYLKMIKDRQTLFDEDRRGIWIGEGMGMFTWGPCRQTNVDVSVLPEPLSFNPGDELIVQISANEATSAALDVNFGLIERVTFLE